MTMSSEKDKRIAKAESDAKRQKKKSSKPERYNNPVKDTLRTQGKGDRYRVIKGWYSDEMTRKFNKIFGRIEKETKERQKEYSENRDITPHPEHDKKVSGTIPPEFEDE